MRRARAKLQDATGIRSDDHLGVCLLHAVHFLGEQFQRRFRLRHVIDAGRAAALVGQRHFHEFHSRDSANQFARGFADFLSVRQMARILISDAQRNGPQRRGEADFRQKFGDVSHFAGELHGLRVGRIVVREKMRVFLEC